MSDQKGPGELLTIEEVCELLRVDRTTLWRRRKRGQFPQPVKINGYTARYRRATVLKWMRENYGHIDD